ncbi:Cullin-3 [Serendipita sp. 405]|nr:Cullin-3 [Serendipita sp. 397]KAG8854824.1 Cullin-3 [Serendipita sp. 405]
MASTQAIRKAKGKIKPPRKHGPDTSIQDTWASLSHAIKEIQNERAHQLSFEENYRYAYNLVLFRQGDFLYRNVKSLITENLSNLTEEYIIPAFATGNHEDPVTRGQEGEVLMKGVRKVWDKHNSSMRKLSDILKYMDRVYTVSAEVPQIIPAGLKIFIDDVLHRTTAPVQEQVVNAILATAVRAIVEANLLSPHLQTIISMPESGLDVMIDLNRLDDLNRIYRLFFQFSASTGGPQALRKGLKESIISRGKAINESNDASNTEVNAPEEDGEKEKTGKAKGKTPAPVQTLNLALKWVQDAVDLKDRFDSILKSAFQGDRTCELAISEALGSFINQNPRAPEFVSLFIDENLKKGLKGKTDDEIEQVLDKTITLFRFLTDKDTFERYYKTHLARRLLFNRSVSDDAERGMLAKLKVECGVQFTKKMEGMFNDMKLSSDVVTAYRDYLSNTTAPAVEINVTVMTSTFWPTTNSGATCTLPIQLQQACSSFERFYNTRHSGRRLTWQPALGNADVKVQFKAKRHDLNVTTMAIVILLLFENIPDDDFLTYEVTASSHVLIVRLA